MSCSDDRSTSSSSSSSALSLFDDETQFVGKPDVVQRHCGISTTKMPRLKRSAVPFICKNCGIGCKEPVFGCACTVECALGCFRRQKDETRYKLVCAQFRRVPAYRIATDIPRCTMFNADNEVDAKTFIQRNVDDLYHAHDLRRLLYITQLETNGVEFESDRRSALKARALTFTSSPTKE